MKKNNRKGFTIVELVIVIAVIAILAAVLIPTFSGMVEKANDSAVLQETRAAVTVLLAEKEGVVPEGTYFAYQKTATDDIRWFQYVDGELDEINSTNAPQAVDNNDELYTKDGTSMVYGTTTGEGDAAVTTPNSTKVLEDLSPYVEIVIIVTDS